MPVIRTDRLFSVHPGAFHLLDCMNENELQSFLIRETRKARPR